MVYKKIGGEVGTGKQSWSGGQTDFLRFKIPETNRAEAGVQQTDPSFEEKAMILTTQNRFTATVQSITKAD